MAQKYFVPKIPVSRFLFMGAMLSCFVSLLATNSMSNLIDMLIEPQSRGTILPYAEVWLIFTLILILCFLFIFRPHIEQPREEEEHVRQIRYDIVIPFPPTPCSVMNAWTKSFLGSTRPHIGELIYVNVINSSDSKTKELKVKDVLLLPDDDMYVIYTESMGDAKATPVGPGRQWTECHCNRFEQD